MQVLHQALAQMKFKLKGVFMKDLGFKLLYIITALVMFVEIGFAIKGSLFTDIADLPTGTLQNSYPSIVTGEKIMNVYLVKNNIGEGIRIEIVKGEEAYNIFWQTGIDTVEARWTNDDTVMINDVPLDANDRFGYDCRRGYSLFDEGSLEDNFANFEEQEEQHEEK